MQQKIKHIQIDEIDIYSFQIAQYISQISSLSSTLTPEEMERANRFHFEKDTNRFIVCRGLLRSLLGEKLQFNPSNIIIEYNEFGKPELTKKQNTLNYQFNISHSGEYGLIGITTGTPIGIDIEEIKTTENKGEILKSQFNKNEYSYFKKTENKDACFFNIWSQKEAVIKASGEGFSFGLKDWSIKPGQTCYTLEVKGLKYNVRKLDIDTHYSAAMAILKNDRDCC